MRNWTLRWVTIVPCPTHPAQALQQVREGLRRTAPSPIGAPSPQGLLQAGPGQPFPGSGLFTSLPPCRKSCTHERHQDVFQDLNRKLQHTEKDKDVLGPDNKVWRTGSWGGFGGRSESGAGAWKRRGRGYEPLGKPLSSSSGPYFIHSFSLSPGLAWPSSCWTLEKDRAVGWVCLLKGRLEG